MNIYHLKYFIDAARLGSVSQSAQLNFVSHSAVSQAIKGLEAFFDVSLIYHAKRKFQLTPQGEQCLAEGQTILQLLQDTKESIQSNQKEIRGQLTLIAPQSLIVDSLYKTFALYKKKYPLVKLNLKTGPAAQVRSAITSSDADVGLLVEDGKTATYNVMPINSGHFILISKTKKIDMKNSKIIVTAKDKLEVLQLAKNYKAQYKKEMTIDMEVMSWGVIKKLVETNQGVGYVPDYCVTKELEAGKLYQIKQLPNLHKYEVKAIWQKEKRLHPNALAFIELLKENQHF